MRYQEEIAEWADQIRETVRTERPALPEGVKGRMREKWSPLKRVAAAAGGDWAEKVDAMALQDLEQYEMDKEDGLVMERPHVVLLRDAHRIFPEDETFIASTALVNALINTNPAIWGDTSNYGKALTTKRLGMMLAKHYRIHSVIQGRGLPKGYMRTAFDRAWHQMGVTPPNQSSASSASSASYAAPAEAADVHIRQEPFEDGWKHRPCAKCGNLALTKNSEGLCQLCKLDNAP